MGSSPLQRSSGRGYRMTASARRTRMLAAVFVIRLDVIKNQERNVAKTTILHEMCHVKTWGESCHIPGQPSTCRRWLVELHRIMLEGAFDDLV
jgi:hypothetical protein